MEMHFKTYEYILTLAEERSFSKASKRLFISQPSLSQYVSRVESELGILLFDRSRVPLTLTYEGELYVETVRDILNLHRQLLNTYDDLNKLEKGRLNIGITPSKANHPLPFILPAFKKQYPYIDLTVTEASSSALEELLEKWRLDVCILNLPITSSNIVSEPLFTEKILLAVPKTNSVSEIPQKIITYPDIKKLENEKFILLLPGQRLRQIANGVFAKAGLKPKILLETGNIETAVKLASSGMGCAFIPESFVPPSSLTNTSKYFVIDEPPLTWTIGAAFQKEGYVTKAARVFVDVTKNVINEIFHDK